MATEEKETAVIATTLQGSVESLFAAMSKVPFSQDPEISEKDIIEYNSRMRVFGLEKFNGPCFVASCSFYLSEENLKNHAAHGTVVIYLEEDMSTQLLKTLGYKDFNENDEESVLNVCGEFCTALSEQFKNDLQKIGYKDFKISEPLKYKNSISEGVEFNYDQYKMHEISFFMWKQKVLVCDVTMAPIGAAGN